jgi:serine/threonine protein phosphatase 1
MVGRTFAIGDIHGETEHLACLISRLPGLTSEDTLVFLGDYLDRGPNSKQVVQYLMKLPSQIESQVICLRGNHEDAWLRVSNKGWDEFLLPVGNGCLATYRSFAGGPQPVVDEMPRQAELMEMSTGAFIPDEVLKWMEQLPYWYEDEHAIYVHAGLPPSDDGFKHPSKVDDPMVLLWVRTQSFFRDYRGKTVVFGHTHTEFLPQELSSYTPEDPTDLWAGKNAVGLDTGCGSGGFLSAFELPAQWVYESR